MKNSCLTLLLLLAGTFVFAQTEGVSISSSQTAPHHSAMLDVQSATRGLLAPRMTKAQMNAIQAPAAGLLVYVTDATEKQFYYYDGATWKGMGGGSGNLWQTDGTNVWRPSGSVGVAYNGSAFGSSLLRISNDNATTIGTTRIQGSLGGPLPERGTYMGFNGLLNSNFGQFPPLSFTKLKSSDQRGCAIMHTDHYGNLSFQAYDAGVGFEYDEKTGNFYDPFFHIMSNGAVGIGTNTSKLNVEFPKMDPISNKNGGTIILRSQEAKDDGKHLRYMVVGVDGNEINCYNEGGTNSSILFLNHNVGGTVRIGGYDPNKKTNLQVQGTHAVDGDVITGGNIKCSQSITVDGNINTAGGINIEKNISVTNGYIDAIGTTNSGIKGWVYAQKFQDISDINLKKNISPIFNGLSTILQINPVSFYWRSGEDNTQNFGFIAQEIEKIPALKDLVSESKNSSNPGEKNTVKTLNYDGFIPFLVKGMQEQQTQIANLQEQLSAQQETIARQQTQMQQLLERLEKLEAANDQGDTGGH